MKAERHRTCCGRVMMGATLLLAGFAVGAGAQTSGPSPNMPFTVSGKIGTVSAGKFQLDTGGNVFFVVRYSSATRITRADGSAGNRSDLRTGTRVDVKGDLAENGDVHAKTIRLEGRKGKKREGT